ncbi:MAG: hypothetical protein HY451_00385 [Parcubacteria group bacterium]|nr:hypothetical protein [Parcubacteria group bacterium]
MSQKSSISSLPEFFRPLLWSYDFDSLDLSKNKKTVILNTINYGDLKHWRWIINYYGKEEIKKVLETVPARQLRSRVRRLASLIFELQNLNYASRGIK